MGQGQLGGLPSKQGGTGDRKGDANNKKEKKYEPAALPTRVGKKQRKQKWGIADPRRQEAAEAEGTRSSRRSIERDREVER
jgi:26S proteasome regulatory subunit T2